MASFGAPERVPNYGETPLDDEGRIPHEFAMQVAQDLKARLSPACERIEIAGSLRRKRPTVKDIELVYIPKVESISNLIGEPIVHRNFLEELLDHLLNCDYTVRVNSEDVLVSGGVFEKRSSKDGRFTYGENNKLLIHKPTRIPVDVFAAKHVNWGMTLLVRTGSAGFNKRVMTRFQQLRMQGHAYAGVSTTDGEVDCPDEEIIFKLLGWEFMLPEERS